MRSPGGLLAAASAFAVLALPQAGHAAFSNDKNNPTLLPWSEILSIAGTVLQTTGAAVGGVSPDAQYVSFTVPIGYEFTSLKLVNYNSSDDRGFVALQAGDKWTAVPNTSTGALPGALAYHHFGSGAGSTYGSLCSQSYTGGTTPVSVCATDPIANSDLFTRSINGPIGGPLPAGPYTLWLQQTAATPVGFTFQATSTAVPAPLPLLGLGAGFGVSRRLRRRIRGRGR
ncbi:MAG: hypothetical protein ACKOZW_09705 [Cyanobium sp.]